MRPLPPLRKPAARTGFVLAVVAALIALSNVHGFATTFGASTNGLAAGDRLVASCGAGMALAYTTGFDSHVAGNAVTGVDLSDIPAGCLGKSLSLTFADGSNRAVGSPVAVTLPASGTTDSVSIDPSSNTIDAAEVSAQPGPFFVSRTRHLPPKKTAGYQSPPIRRRGHPAASKQCPRHESNMRTRFRKPLLYPLSYGGRGTLCRARPACPLQPAKIGSMSDVPTVADLLHEAGETHHVVYRIVDGDDPDWASWYADWLLDHSELPQLLGGAPVRSHLVHELVQLDRDYTSEAREERWEDWYAERLLKRFGAG